MVSPAVPNPDDSRRRARIDPVSNPLDCHPKALSDDWKACTADVLDKRHMARVSEHKGLPPCQRITWTLGIHEIAFVTGVPQAAGMGNLMGQEPVTGTI